MSPAAGNAGGVERYSHMIGDVLRADGWNVSTVTPTREPSRWTYRLGGAPLTWAVSTGRAAGRRMPADLIIGNGFLGIGAPRSVPSIQVYHGTMVGQTLTERHGLKRRDFVRRMVSYWAVDLVAIRRADRLVVTSEQAGEETRRFYRRSADAMIHSGVHEGIFAPTDRAEARAELGLPADARLALFVGRPEYRKGADLFVEGARRGGFEPMVAGAQNIDGARHLGSLDPARLALAYAASDVMLFPTRYESCSHVILEAMAEGVPVVTTPVAWTNEFLRAVPGYRALIVEPSVESIADRLRDFDPVQSAQLARRAREHVVERNGTAAFERAWRELIGSVVDR